MGTIRIKTKTNLITDECTITITCRDYELESVAELFAINFKEEMKKCEIITDGRKGKIVLKTTNIEEIAALNLWIEKQNAIYKQHNQIQLAAMRESLLNTHTTMVRKGI